MVHFRLHVWRASDRVRAFNGPSVPLRFLLKAVRAKLSTERPITTPGNRTVYAVGDLHGRLDQLDRLLVHIRHDRLELLPAADRPPILIFLGDYVDRGPDSCGVIERILELMCGSEFEVRPLMGNHEEAMLTFLADADFGPVWAEYGGIQTLASYGVVPPLWRTDPGEWRRARDALANRLPLTHRHFLTHLELMIELGDYLFVHAGLRPGVPLADQQKHDLLWIREPFLSSDHRSGKVVVHGHTPGKEPYVGNWRIGVDTGAYASGVLTAVRLSGPDRTLLRSSD